MSKYANIEQIKEVIRTEWVRYMPMELDISLAFVLGKISEVPTIEVGEDYISRKWLLDKAERGFDNILYCDYDIFHMLRDIEDAPSIVPTQTNANQRKPTQTNANQRVESVESVEPTTEQSSMVGEWQI